MNTQVAKICIPILAALLCLGLTSQALAQDDGWEDYTPTPPPAADNATESPPVATPAEPTSTTNSTSETPQAPLAPPQTATQAVPPENPAVAEPPTQVPPEPDPSPEQNETQPKADPPAGAPASTEEGADPLVVGAAQYATACLAPSIGCLLSWIPFVGQFAWLAMPALTGWFVQLVGDDLGKKKTGIFPSILGSYVGSFCISGPCVIGGAVIAYLSFAGGFYGSATTNRPEPLLLFGLGLGVGGCVALTGHAAGAAIPVLAYHLFGEEEIGAGQNASGSDDNAKDDDPIATTPAHLTNDVHPRAALAY